MTRAAAAALFRTLLLSLVVVAAGRAPAEAQTCACNDFSTTSVTVGGNMCAGSDGAAGCDGVYSPSEDLEIVDPGPALWLLNGRSTGTPSIWWEMRATGAALEFTEYDDAVTLRTPITIESGTPEETLYLDSTGFVGIGTSTPAAMLHLVNPDTDGEVRVRLQSDVGSTTDRVDLWHGSSGLWFQSVLDNGPPTASVKFNHGAPNNSLVVETATGDVGLGTSAPSAAVHVRRANGSAQVLVEEVGVAQTRRLLDLQNNGGVRMRLVDNSTGTVWAYQNIASEFRINAGGAGDPFVLDPAGNLTIGGTLTQNSDRDTKAAVEPVETDDVLSRVARLPISTWVLKDDVRKVRHMGPMAQDFAAAFGLGADDRHVAPVDMAAAALASIQALDRRGRDRDERVAALEAENAHLAARLAALEALLRSKLAASPGH